jgi:hypothetical protein
MQAMEEILHSLCQLKQCINLSCKNNKEFGYEAAVNEK